MLAGIVGDVIGSVYEAHQWKHPRMFVVQPLPIETNPNVEPLFKNLKWVRKNYSWTDDSLCTLALYSAYILDENPIESLQDMCLRYGNESIGFGKSFEKWLENPVAYNSWGNGSIMRIGFIPFIDESLAFKRELAQKYTEISHDHPDSLQAVDSFIVLFDEMKRTKSKKVLQEFLQDNDFGHSVQELHELRSFELNAMKTLLQAAVAVVEANDMHEVLQNTFYIGGDSDTLATVAANLASAVHELPDDLWDFAQATLAPYPELSKLVEHFKLNLWK